MKVWTNSVMFFVVAVLVLAACGGDPAPVQSNVNNDAGGTIAAPPAVVSETEENAILSTSYRDALGIDMQLAIGTMGLENSNLGVSADQAATLLPLWRVLDSLNRSGSASETELNAVVKQITAAMTGDQVANIAAMELTQDKVQTMIENGSLSFGRGFGRQTGEGSGSDGMRPGGGPGGGLLGGPGSGGGFPGGGPGGDPSAFATRQAELAASGEDPLAAFLDQAAAGMVVRLLETKTGEAPSGGFGAFGQALTVVSASTGITVEALRAGLAEGLTLTAMIEAVGYDVTEVTTAVEAELADTSLPEGQELSTWVESLFGGSSGEQALAE